MKTKKTTKTETPTRAETCRFAPAVIAGSYDALKIIQQHRMQAASRQRPASAPPAAPTRPPETTVQKRRTPKGLIDEAATFFRRTRRTVQRWLKDPEKVPSEWAGFGSGVLASEKAWEDWKMGLGLREAGAEAIAKGSAALLGRGGWHKTGPR